MLFCQVISDLCDSPACHLRYSTSNLTSIMSESGRPACHFQHSHPDLTSRSPMPGHPHVSAEDFFQKRYIFLKKQGPHVPFLLRHHFHPIKIGPLLSLGYLILSKSVDLDGILANYLCNYASFCHFTSCQPVVLHNFISDYKIRSNKRYKQGPVFLIFVPFSEKLLFALPVRHIPVAQLVNLTFISCSEKSRARTP